MTASAAFQVPPPPHRFPTREVRIGSLRLGAHHPILVQSMTIADTCDTDRVVAEVRRLVEAGCPLVRLTAPSMKDAENLREIRRRLHADGIRVPMVADIHFTPNAALLAAEIVEKVRINPGNYADRKKFAVFEISDAEYRAELERIRERFLPLVRKLKEHGAALRIGTNHGSLSDRIMNRYGDTPEGMVESALEFVRICREESYHDIVLSMKSSIPSVMIAAYRLLVRRMIDEEMDYPLHIGVTEAGDGLEGRIKSAIGIGSLLAAGIGDTIRVSLTEDSHHEIPAARAILAAVARERGLLTAGFVAGGEVTPAAGLRGAPVLTPVPGVQTEPVSTPTSGARTGPVSTPAPGARTEPVSASAPGGRTEPVPTPAPVVDAGALYRALSLEPSPVRRSTLPWKLRGFEIGGPHPIRVELRLDGSRDLDDSARAQLARAGGREGAELVSLLFPASVPLEDARRRIAAVRDAAGIIPLLIELTDDRTDRTEGAGGGSAAGLAARVTALSPLADAIGLPAPLDHPASSSPLRDTAGGLIRGAAGRPIRWRVDASRFADLRTSALPHLGNALPALSENTRTGGSACAFVAAPGAGLLERIRTLAAAIPGDPVFLEVPATGPDPALLAGSMLSDGIGDALCLVPFPGGGQSAAHPWPPGGREWVEEPVLSAYRILQACRIRLTRAEFIACPSCGRTQFDLQTTTERIRRRTGHLSGVKIAIMGCIVNGPGEMADAHFGYVGSGRAKVDLYVGKARVAQGIPETEAEDRLVALLHEHGVWVDPSE